MNPDRDEGVSLKSDAQRRREQRNLFLRCFLSRTEYELCGFGRSDKDYSYMLNFLSIHGIRNRFRLILNDNNLLHVRYELVGDGLMVEHTTRQGGSPVSTIVFHKVSQD